MFLEIGSLIIPLFHPCGFIMGFLSVLRSMLMDVIPSPLVSCEAFVPCAFVLSSRKLFFRGKKRDEIGKEKKESNYIFSAHKELSLSWIKKRLSHRCSWC